MYDTGLNFYTLVIDFSSPIASFATSFALDTNESTGTLSAAEYLGGTFEDTIVATATPPAGYKFAEGILTVSDPGGFDKLILTSTIGDYALGEDTSGTGGGPNESSNGTSTPEPVSLLLSAPALVALAFYRKRRVCR